MHGRYAFCQSFAFRKSCDLKMDPKAFTCLLLAAAALCVNGRGDPLSAIQGLVERILGKEFVDKFQYEVINDYEGRDVFEIDVNDTSKMPILRGNTGVALASALNWYLKYTAGNSISWGVDRTGDHITVKADDLPLPSSHTRMVSPVKYRYYMNVCTHSYSAVWWDAARWERELDWMAMNGINMPLSFTGQEYVWYNFYSTVGLKEQDILNYFSGPAFLAWQRMGNIKRWAGPIDKDWMKNQWLLQQFISDRSTEYGMYRVLPGFAGHVPAALKEIYPKANFTKTGNWGHFNSTYSGDYLLEPTDPLFVELGATFYKILIEMGGTDHLYNTDTYNEMLPSSNNSNFLKQTNAAIYSAMEQIDKEAIFVMQGWLFENAAEFWNNVTIEAFLSGVPDDKMIILDLNSIVGPVWRRTQSYFGKPFVWCLLHNFGGLRAIYGNLTGITNGPPEALATPGNTMVGVGLTPEAIEQNPVVYDLMCEMGWRSKPVDVWDWVSLYLKRRYGGKYAIMSDVWYHLLRSVYQYHFSWDAKSLIEKAPELEMQYFQAPNTSDVAVAWQLMYYALDIHSQSSQGTFQYDLVDVGHQSLSNLFVDVHAMVTLAYQEWLAIRTASPYSQVMASLGEVVLEIIGDMDQLLSSDINFLLGIWIEGARNSVSSPSAKDLYEFNARNQITLWGYNESEIDDYASKAWGGLVADYYLPRWKLFMDTLQGAVSSRTPANFTAYRKKRLAIEEAWNRNTSAYPVKPTGNTGEITRSLLEKYYFVSESGYMVRPNYDITDPNSDLFGQGRRPWTQIGGQLRFLCNINPLCLGYTSSGFLKNSTSGLAPQEGVTVYIKVQ